MSQKDKTIGFRGTEEYRAHIHQLALNRRMKVQDFLELAVRNMESADNYGNNSPTLIPEKAPLTQDENDVKTCATPQEVELRRILSAIFASGNETVIASAANALAASEEILQLLEVARGRADAEPTPSERGVTGDHQLPEKRGGDVQDIGGGFKKLRGRQG